MNDDQLLRYSRQIMLPQVDITGQQRLRDARALIIGLGGLGSPVAMYLAAAGVGTLVLVDDDVVDVSNLQRQVLHRESDIGRPKVDSARDHLKAINPEVGVIHYPRRLEEAELRAEVAAADVVLDCSDNFPTRFLLNELCAQEFTALVSGAAIRFEGQVAVYHHENIDAPCYRCLYRDDAEEQAATCSENGVIAPLVGIIGSVQALEALKVLLRIGETLGGRLLLLDGLSMEWRTMKLRKDTECPVCGCNE